MLVHTRMQFKVDIVDSIVLLCLFNSYVIQLQHLLFALQIES